MAESGDMRIARRLEAFEAWLRSLLEAVHFIKYFTVRHLHAALAGVLGCELCVLHADGTDSSAAPVLTVPSHDTLPAAAAVTENGSASAHTEETAQSATAGSEHAQAETAAFSSPGKDQLSSPGLSVATKVRQPSPKAFASMHHHTSMMDALSPSHISFR